MTLEQLDKANMLQREMMMYQKELEILFKVSINPPFNNRRKLMDDLSLTDEEITYLEGNRKKEIKDLLKQLETI